MLAGEGFPRADGVTIGNGLSVGEGFLPAGERVSGAGEFGQHDEGATVVHGAAGEREAVLDVALAVVHTHLHVELHSGDPDRAHCRGTVPLRRLVHLPFRAVGHWNAAFRSADVREWCGG